MTIKDGKVESIGSYDLGNDAIDYGDLMITPGLIDIHNHGYAGWSFTGSSAKEDIDHLRKRMLMEGVTSMLATSSTLGMSGILESIKGNNVESMSSIIGFHIEGPFLNSEQHGAAPPDTQFPLPDLSYMEEIYERSQGLLKIMTIAPEMEGSEEIIAFLKARDVKVSVGHSNVTYEELVHLKADIDSMTHLGNAMRGIHHREIGALGFGMLDQDVWVEMIADGIHLSDPMMALIFQSRGFERIMLISDTVPFAGLEEGTYDSINGQIIVERDGTLLNEHGNINGSSFPIIHDLDYLFRHFDLALPDLFRMASYNQAKFLALEGIGQIKEGYQADLLVMDKKFNLVEIYKDGKAIEYKKLLKNTNTQVEQALKDKEYLNFYSLRS